ncbi:hypothetical protein Lbys_2403 [Leadbetterella byssophila DSM 17132]|uniref:Uncharacterized protein n=1 Tax=Leadbetterella byssophila (strain DSM 17132 / JCM 16389 / KACC 11308 / NBRC 106382 / 4M15) TaxID=649349 RepID=E4RX37_LEAB4|nr:hypothetical protein [Leadbetterella byssophila]ADQ18076.1 hypothetical protein Lbys_2403 [Leadbetterella byssophila DSM 17132]
MKKLNILDHYLKGILIISISAVFIKCDSTDLVEPISGDKCYEGEAIHAFCPSFLVVNVRNGNIGQKWTFNGKRYNNALLIKNAGRSDASTDTNSITPSSKVYFQVDVDATNNNENCQIIAPCLQWAEERSSPAKSVCVKFISNQKCNSI